MLFLGFGFVDGEGCVCVWVNLIQLNALAQGFTLGLVFSRCVRAKPFNWEANQPGKNSGRFGDIYGTSWG